MGSDYLSVSCFGKLPCYGDYLKFGVNRPSPRALQELMLEGVRELAHAESEGGHRDVATEGRIRILFGVPGSRELVVGVLRPSRDSGGRHFPFLAFVQISRKLFGRHYAMLPLALRPVWEALDDAWDSLSEIANERDFRDALAGYEIPPPVELNDARADFQGRGREDAAKMFEGLAGSSPTHLTPNMPEFLQRLKTSEKDGFGARFPVSEDLSEAAFDISMWMDLVNRQFRLRHYEPAVFLDERPHPGRRSVVLQFGPTMVTDYLQFVRPTGEGRFLRPTEAGNSSDDATSVASITYGELLDLRF